jgi:hypothetical protein
LDALVQIDPGEDHARFADAVGREPYWTVANPRRAFHLAWGPVGLLVFWASAVVTLVAPVAWLGYLATSSHNFWILAWAPVSVFVVLIADRTALGLLVSLALFLLVGLPLAFFFGVVQTRAALTPSGAYFVVTVVRNIVLRVFLRRLAGSRDAWQRVCDEGLISQRQETST